MPETLQGEIFLMFCQESLQDLYNSVYFKKCLFLIKVTDLSFNEVHSKPA